MDCVEDSKKHEGLMVSGKLKEAKEPCDLKISSWCMVIGCGREHSLSIVMNIERSKDVLPKDIWVEKNQNFAEKENEIALSHIDEQFENHIYVEKEIVCRTSL